eukprot:285839-Prorocentrum_minimum.AAC.1
MEIRAGGGGDRTVREPPDDIRREGEGSLGEEGAGDSSGRQTDRQRPRNTTETTLFGPFISNLFERFLTNRCYPAPAPPVEMTASTWMLQASVWMLSPVQFRES